MWQLNDPPLDLVARTIVVYFAFLAALRLSGKRELGQFTIFDLALVLLAANALQPAMTGPEASIPGALIIIATIFALNRLVALARRRFPPVRRLLELAPAVVGRDGRWIEPAVEREGLDEEDLEAALRERGLESVEQMKLAVLEHDGSISIVERDREEDRGEFVGRRRRRYRKRTEG